MPVYNAEAYLQESIKSILDQTFEDFEFIIVDDQSTDNSKHILQSFKDERIKFISTPKNLGRAGADNYAIQFARGEYIAKMDSDDISLPYRLDKQVSFLDDNPKINILGTWSQNFGQSNVLNKYPVDPETAKCWLLCSIPVTNPSIMMRRTLFDRGCRYNEHYRQAEDYDFFVRYINLIKVSNIPESLIKYRVYPSEKKINERKRSAEMIQKSIFLEWGIPVSDRDLLLHTSISYYDNVATEENLKETHSWLLKILEHNLREPWFDHDKMEKFIAKKWFDVCYNSKPKKCQTRKVFRTGYLSKKIEISLISKAKHFIRDVLD